MGREPGQIAVGPVGETDNLAGLCPGSGNGRGLQDIEAGAVDEKSVIPEQIAQLGDRRMIVGKRLSFELVQGPFHLCLVQSHHVSFALWESPSGDLRRLADGFRLSTAGLPPSSVVEHRDRIGPPPRRLS